MAKKTAPLLPSTDELLRQFGDRLRLARRRRRLSAKQVAERAGMSPMTLRSLERGGSGVTMGAYLAVMQVLGVERDLDQLAKADPVGRELQDTRLPASRTARIGQSLATSQTGPKRTAPVGDAVAQLHRLIGNSPQAQLRKIVESLPGEQLRKVLQSLPDTQMRKAMAALPSENLRATLCQLVSPRKSIQELLSRIELDWITKSGFASSDAWRSLLSLSRPPRRKDADKNGSHRRLLRLGRLSSATSTGRAACATRCWS